MDYRGPKRIRSQHSQELRSDRGSSPLFQIDPAFYWNDAYPFKGLKQKYTQTIQARAHEEIRPLNSSTRDYAEHQ